MTTPAVASVSVPRRSRAHVGRAAVSVRVVIRTAICCRTQTAQVWHLGGDLAGWNDGVIGRCLGVAAGMSKVLVRERWHECGHCTLDISWPAEQLTDSRRNLSIGLRLARYFPVLMFNKGTCTTDKITTYNSTY